MEEQAPLRTAESDNWEFFVNLPEFDRERLSQREIPQAVHQRQGQRQRDTEPEPLESLCEKPVVSREPSAKPPADQRAGAAAQGTVVDE